MTNRAWPQLVVLLALCIAASSCGGDDPTTLAEEMLGASGDAHDGGAEHDQPDSATEESVVVDEPDPDAVDGAVAPTIGLDVTADPAGGINVFVETTHFVVVAGAPSGADVDGSGHFRLSIDGEPMLRFYNDAIYVGGVTEGEVEVMVELMASDERPYAVDGKPVVATTTFTVPPHAHDDHRHGDPEPIRFDGAAPTLALTVEPDPVSGYNAFVTLDGMVLSGRNASGAHVPGEGHLHIVVNGQKLGRLYGTATHIPVLPDGEVEIRIVAYTNDHMVYVDGDGAPIEAVTTVRGG
jgi:hypothetical protein